MTTIPPEPDTKKRAITYGDGLPLAIAIIGRRRADKAAKTLKRERKLREHLKAVASFRSRLTAICDRAASLAASVSDIVGNNARSALLLPATCDVAATDAHDDLREREKLSVPEGRPSVSSRKAHARVQAEHSRRVEH